MATKKVKVLIISFKGPALCTRFLIIVHQETIFIFSYHLFVFGFFFVICVFEYEENAESIHIYVLHLTCLIRLWICSRIWRQIVLWKDILIKMSKLYHLYADITFMHYSVYYFHFQTNNIDNKPHGIDNNTYTFFFYSTEASKLKCLILLPDLLLLSYIHSCIHGIMYIINRLDSIKGHKKGVRNNYIVV